MSGKVLHRTLRIKDVPVGDSRVAAGDRELTVHRSVSKMAYTRQMVVVVWGVADSEIKIFLCWEPRADKCFPFKAWSRSEYSRGCFAHFIFWS